eukprot:scaffold154234_cov15-Tisochrysis_lutea.AAC.2
MAPQQASTRPQGQKNAWVWEQYEVNSSEQSQQPQQCRAVLRTCTVLRSTSEEDGAGAAAQPQQQQQQL